MRRALITEGLQCAIMPARTLARRHPHGWPHPAVRSALAETPVITPSTLPRIGSVDDICISKILQHRNDRDYRDEFPETLSVGSGRSLGAAAVLRIGHRFGPVPVPAADRPFRRALAKVTALAPAYARVSGTWANSTFFRLIGTTRRRRRRRVSTTS